MKHPRPKDQSSRFSGTLRHYHRSGGSRPQRSWEEWVDGETKSGRSASSAVWLKRVIITLAILALVAIVVGLIIELR